MKNLSRALLVVGALVLALLAGLLIGRSQRATPIADGNASTIHIDTTAPPMAAAPPLLPAPVEKPKPVAVPKIALDQQVQEDAAAVGMTTRDEADAPSTHASSATTTAPPADGADGAAASGQAAPNG
jgi:hypothetical protein